MQHVYTPTPTHAPIHVYIRDRPNALPSAPSMVRGCVRVILEQERGRGHGRGRSLALEGETRAGRNGERRGRETEGLGGPGLIAVHSDVPDHTPAASAAIPLLILVKYRCQGPELY